MMEGVTAGNWVQTTGLPVNTTGTEHETGVKTGGENSTEVIFVAVLTRSVTPGMIKHRRQGQERREVAEEYFLLLTL